jgi:hypothetical protein
MANWDKLNGELDSALNSMSPEDWAVWKINMQNKSIINWEMIQKLMAKKKTITVCTGIGSNMFFPEYITIEIPSRKQSIVDDWLEEHGNPTIDTKVGEHLEKVTKSKKNG